VECWFTMDRCAMDFSNEVSGEARVACKQDTDTKHIIVNKPNIFLDRCNERFHGTGLASMACFSFSRMIAEGFLSRVEHRRFIVSILPISGIKSVATASSKGTVASNTLVMTDDSLGCIFSLGSSEKEKVVIDEFSKGGSVDYPLIDWVRTKLGSVLS